jgi:hypothetical protein
MAVTRKRPSIDDLMLAELRGLRKDLVAFAHLLLRQDRLDRDALKRFSLSPKAMGIGGDGRTDVLLNPAMAAMTDPFHELDRDGGA